MTSTAQLEPPAAGSTPAPSNSVPNIEKLLSDPTQLAALNEKLRIFEGTLRKDAEHVAELHKAGRMAESAELKKDVRLRAEKLKLFKLQLLQAQQAYMLKVQGHVQAQGGPSGSDNIADASAAQPSGVGMSSSVRPLEAKALAGRLSTATARDLTAEPDPGVWQGKLTWRGFDADTFVLRELQTQVLMACPKGDVMRADLWPSVLSLAPSQHPAVPSPVLLQWLERQAQTCVVMRVMAHPQAPDPQTNEEHFRELNRLLVVKNVYALAAWPPNKPENRLLIFLQNLQNTQNPHNVISAAYFLGPGGMPELPEVPDGAHMAGAGPMPPSVDANLTPTATVNSSAMITQQQQMFAQLFQTMTPEQQAEFRQMDTDKQNAVMKQLLTMKLSQVRTQRQQQQLEQIEAQMLNMSLQQEWHQPGMELEGPDGQWATGQQSNVAAFLSQLASANRGQAGPSNPTLQSQLQGPPLMGGPNPMANLMMDMDGEDMDEMGMVAT